MKRFKEFLFLFIPLIVSTILPVIIFVTNQTKNAFVSNAQYLRLFLEDVFFWNAIVNTYFRAIILSALVVIVIALLCHFVKCLRSRKVFYPVSVVLTSVVSFLSTYMNRVNYFGAPMWAYNTQSLISNSPPPVSVTIYDILLALQISFLTTFLFWLVETFILFIKNRKSPQI